MTDRSSVTRLATRAANEEAELNGLLGRVRAANQRLDRSKYDFSDHAIHLDSTLQSYSNRPGEETSPPVFGLFYIAESGAFMAYDVAENMFHPLAGSAA